MKLVLENISKSFPGRKVFEDITFEIEQGKTFVITGPNGSGKSTLMKVIASILPPSSGRVIFYHDERQFSGSDILPYIGLAAPDLFLYDELTANENLHFFARVSGMSANSYEPELKRFGLEGRGDDFVKSYSSGMKQRLKYILALLRNPPLLLLDEPTANLDDSGKALVDEVIRDHDGITIIATNEESELKYASQTIKLGQ
ncbi:MAG: ABC transporter ATP-binding protein [candidate division Zixibacteria bacterium]|nr:ABC transporter ATP-binding protein [candidate division Zixibacteria bacterium]